jgi:hypothetical protein
LEEVKQMDKLTSNGRNSMNGRYLKFGHLPEVIEGEYMCIYSNKTMTYTLLLIQVLANAFVLIKRSPDASVCVACILYGEG